MKIGQIILFPVTLVIGSVIIILAIIIHFREIFQRFLKGQINYRIYLTHQDKQILFNIARGLLILVIVITFVIFALFVAQNVLANRRLILGLIDTSIILRFGTLVFSMKVHFIKIHFRR